MDDLQRFCCQNANCADYGKRGHGNLTVCGHYGSRPQRLLYCRTCKARFSERKGTPLFDTRLPAEQVPAVLHHLAEGCGIRQTSRLVGVSKDTLVRYSLLAGEQARQLHDELVAFSPQTREVPFDEKGSFVGKKEKHCDRHHAADDDCGACWDHVALDPESRLLVSLVIGRRTEEHTQLLVEDFHRRTAGRLRNLLTSDENPAYAPAILEV